MEESISPPGALLRADVAAVDFHGRDAEMQRLQAWCTSDPPVSVRLATGAGGMGKTRLFLQLCERMRSEGWRSGFLRGEGDSQGVADVMRGPSSLLVVVDYAESRVTEIVTLLRAALAARGNARRVVLLARAAGDWWQELKCTGNGVGEILASRVATTVEALPPLALTIEQRRATYLQAATTFARLLGRGAGAGVPFNLCTGLRPDPPGSCGGARDRGRSDLQER